ncbi:hypothetical protein ABT317_30275 [Streptomyces carpinensis]|uniref:Aldehyde dehydrogenase domain-containing protein n=1 Tax=Streptomyces carpinensis TaxID=66369 RepID=A0ABV1WAB5_9ACTN
MTETLRAPGSSPPPIQAVGFTSRTAGLALVCAAASRPRPIPVYAEMSSINPAVLLPGALAERAANLGELVVSLTLGAGQFCTNPGLLLLRDDNPYNIPPRRRHPPRPR